MTEGFHPFRRAPRAVPAIAVPPEAFPQAGLAALCNAQALEGAVLAGAPGSAAAR